MASLPDAMGRAVLDSAMRGSTSLSAFLIHAAVSDDPPDVEGLGLWEGEEGVDRDDEAPLTSAAALLGLEKGLERFCASAEGALAYLLFLSFFEGDEGLELEEDLGEARASSLWRFFCGERSWTDMVGNVAHLLKARLGMEEGE